MSKNRSAAAKARAEARLANIKDPDAATSGQARTRVSKSGKKKTIGPPIEGLPLADEAAITEAPPKVSPRGLYDVIVRVGGHVYQFTQRAVDEAEAICRVFDKHESLKALANQCKYTITKIEDAPVATEPAGGDLVSTTMPGHVQTVPKVAPEPAPAAKQTSDRVATAHAK